MKKKISLLGIVLILIFAFTGCSSSNTIEYDQAELEQYAEFIIQNFSAMTDEELDSFEDLSDLELDLTMLNTGVPVSGENFVTMTDAWQAAEEECGEFVSASGTYTAEVTNEGVTLTTSAEFADRTASIDFMFDDNLNMESITVSADYSTGEILQKAGLNTILGMGTVFVVLIFLSFVIWLLKFIPVLEKKFRKAPAYAEPVKADKPAAVPAAIPEETAAEDDSELVAVIAAAVAAAEGTSVDGFVVRSIKRRKTNKWN